MVGIEESAMPALSCPPTPALPRPRRLALPGTTLSLCLRLVLLGAAAPLHAATPAVLVDTVVVSAGASSLGLELDGQLQATRQATVSAQSVGNVLALLVQAGDRVRAGQLLARVDDRSSSASLAQSDAGVRQADTLARLARAQVTRQRALRAEGFISQAALDDAEAQLNAAEAGLAQAQAGRSQAALAQGYAQVLAPFDGVVQATLVETGDLAGPGRPLLTLFAPGALRAVVQLPASQTARLRGRLNEMRIGLPQAGTGAEGALNWITPTRRELLPLADAVAQTMELRLALAAADTRALVPGLNVRVRFAPDAGNTSAVSPGAVGSAAQSTGALRVPAAALLQRGELCAVYVALPGQPVFALRQVRVGPAEGDQWPVLAGLRAGERVAVDAVRAGLAGAQPR
jgi:RND family efflux transporter MFP subunit